MPAQRAKDILEEKLKEFGIHLNDDIVAVITDGASVMTKMGTFLNRFTKYALLMLSILQFVMFFMILN